MNEIKKNLWHTLILSRNMSAAEKRLNSSVQYVQCVLFKQQEHDSGTQTSLTNTTSCDVFLWGYTTLKNRLCTTTII